MLRAGALHGAARGVRELGRVCESTLSATTAVGVNILKNGKDPELKKDEEYPDWLWTLLDRQPTLGELDTRYKEGGADALSWEEAIRYVGIERRQRIADKNRAKSEG